MDMEPEYDPEEIENDPSSKQGTPGVTIEIPLVEALVGVPAAEPGVLDKHDKL